LGPRLGRSRLDLRDLAALVELLSEAEAANEAKALEESLAPNEEDEDEDEEGFIVKMELSVPAL